MAQRSRAAKRSQPRRRFRLLLSIAWFVALLLIMATALTFWGDSFLPAMRRATAFVTGAALRMFRVSATVSGETVHLAGFTLVIVTECTGILPMLIYTAGILAAPFSWKRRLWGIGLGLASLFLLNLIRMLSLAVIGIHWPDSFETAHLVIWQPLYITLTALMWLVWAMRSHHAVED